MSSFFLRVLAVGLGAAAIVVVPGVASAQDPAQAVQADAQRPVPPAAGLPPSAPPVEAPIVRTAGEYSCLIADRGALEEVDARTAADVVCGELVKQKAPVGRYTIRFGRLGSRTRFVVASGEEEREAWLASLDELSVAAARVVEALLTRRTVGQTEKVDSVLASEASAPRTKHGQLSVGLSIIGATTAGVATNVSTGFGLALLYRASRYGLFAEGRATGIGSANEKLAELSLGIGGHWFFSDADFAPFVGGGLQVAAYGLTKNGSSGSGLGTFGEIGLAGFRSSKVGVFTTARAAFPLFDVDPGKGYVVPLTLNLGLTFL